MSTDNLIGRLTTESDESAAVALFVRLCGDFPALRHWLWEDFARDGATRETFAKKLRSGAAQQVNRFSELSSAAGAWAAEVHRLRATFSNRLFGGLTWSQIETLIGRFRAGRADLAAFLLALQWRRAGDTARHQPLLIECLAEYLDPVIRSGDRHRLNQLRTAVSIVAGGFSPKRRRTSVGPANWWKLELLSYLLRHPKPSYTTRELVVHLKSQGLDVKAKHVRRFCARYGIARDMRAGRPRGARTAGSTRPKTRRSKIGGRQRAGRSPQSVTVTRSSRNSLTSAAALREYGRILAGD